MTGLVSDTGRRDDSFARLESVNSIRGSGYRRSVGARVGDGVENDGRTAASADPTVERARMNEVGAQTVSDPVSTPANRGVER